MTIFVRFYTVVTSIQITRRMQNRILTPPNDYEMLRTNRISCITFYQNTYTVTLTYFFLFPATASGNWNDYTCDWKMAFVCVKK